MFDIFSEGSYYEFPSFQIAFFSILLAFVLSSVLAFVYHFTNREAALSRNFIQAMIMSSLVTCMVIMAVGNNVAAGFGIMGAIAIIRFRMRIQNPRNIIFMFSALSVGIAAGVYGYSIAVAGTLLFCIVTIMLYYSPYGSKRLNQEYNLCFMLLEGHTLSFIREIFKEKCQDFRMYSIYAKTKGDNYEYFITLNEDIEKVDFFNYLKQQEGITNISLERSDNLSRL